MPFQVKLCDSLQSHNLTCVFQVQHLTVSLVWLVVSLRMHFTQRCKEKAKPYGESVSETAEILMIINLFKVRLLL